MTYDALLLQCHEGWQRLVDDLLQAARQRSLKFDIVHID